MTRLQLALACGLTTLMVAGARAQPYAYGPGAPPPGAMYPGMAPGVGPGMAPGMRPMMMQPGMYPGGPNPAMMQPGMYGGGPNPAMMMQPGRYGTVPPPAMMQAAMPGGGMPNPGNGGLPPRTAVKADPPRKLPKGVTEGEGGLLYYNGRPDADVNYQNYPVSNPHRLASHQAAVPNAAGPRPMPSMAMSSDQHSAYAPGMMAPSGDCPECNNGYGGNSHWWGGLFSRGPHQGYPGKVGYNWMFSAENVFMWRDVGADRTLVVNNLDEPVLNADAIDFEYENGGRFTAALMGPSGITYQGVYMGISVFQDTVAVFGDNDLNVPGALPAAFGPSFLGADEVRYTYESRIQTAEANVIYPWGSFMLLAGYRWLELDEFARLRATDVFSADSGDFNAFADNQLHGGQIGILGEWEACGLVQFDFRFKFGVFKDIAKERQLIIDPLGTDPSFEAFGSDSDVAFVTEIGTQIVIPLGPMIKTFVGYQVLFIDEVALAPNQFDLSDEFTDLSGTEVVFDGSIILQGVTVGFMANW